MSAAKRNWLILLAFIVLIACGVWYYYSHNQDTGSNGNFTQAKKTASTTKTPPAATKATITPSGSSGSFSVVLPSGWITLSDSQLTRTIGGTKYQVVFQSEPEDTFADPSFTDFDKTLKQTQTAAGTPVYVVQTKDVYVDLSACPTANNVGCEMKFAGKYLEVQLHEYQTGDQFVRGMDLSKASASTAISDFESIAESMSI